MENLNLKLSKLSIISLGLSVLPVNSVIATPPKNPNNVLFIVVDDLRPELNNYSACQMKTPNIDMIARNGILFERAYCLQVISAPSPNSVLTGLRSDAMGINDLNTFFRKKVPDVVTLPQLFEQNGNKPTEVVAAGLYDYSSNKVVTGNLVEKPENKKLLNWFNKLMDKGLSKDVIHRSHPQEIS